METINSPGKTAKPSKPLRQWTGWAEGDAALPGYKGNSRIPISVAAYSVADARRICVEAGLRDPGTRVINDYWSECWSPAMRAMRAIPIERGIWSQKDSETPRRVFPRTANGESPVSPVQTTDETEPSEKELVSQNGEHTGTLPDSPLPVGFEGVKRLNAALALLGCQQDSTPHARQELVASIRKFAVLSGDAQLESACVRLS